MRASLKILLTLLLAVVLAGCAPDDYDRLKDRVEQCALDRSTLQALINNFESQIQQNYAEKKALDEYRESQAAFAKGCNFLWNFCPDSWTETGRNAIERGYAGTTHWYMWAWLATKVMLFISFFGYCLYFVFRRIHIRYLSPLETELKRNREFLQTCDSEVSAREQAIQQLDQTHAAKLKTYSQQEQGYSARLRELENEISESEKKLAQAQKNYAEIARLRNALGSNAS